MNAPIYFTLGNRIPFSKASTLALVRYVAQMILWQYGACYVSRAILLGSHEKDDKCLLPHLTFWAGPPEAITHNAGYTPLAQWLLVRLHHVQHQLMAVTQVFNTAHVITLRSQHQYEGKSNQQKPLMRKA